MLNVGNLTVFYYFVLCLDSYNANVFEWGQFLLIIITVLAILFGALRSRFESMAGIGIAITIQKIIIFCLFLIFGGILSLFSLVTASILADIFSWIFGLVAVHIIAI